jgi:hypothetical protein
VLDFVAIMASCSIRDAALNLRDWFLNSASPSPPIEKGSDTSGEPAAKIDDDQNKPLTFSLREIDHAHPYLIQRGITVETAQTFGTGLFSGRGLMRDRVVIPIHNECGELVAYAGRSIDATEPKYKLPVGFKKSAELFNLHRALEASKESSARIVVCEGFFDCMKVYQAGVRAVVGLMGSSLSDLQETVLKKFARVILFLDGDEAGRGAAQTIASRLIHHTFVRLVDLPDGVQPDQLSANEITDRIGSV